MAQPQQISLSSLDLSQLSEVKRQLDEELNHLTTSFAQLKQAQAKFKACIDDCKEIEPQNKDRKILVPLTSSLYVPGKLSNPENVIVDIGTGYYVSKTRPQATKYYTGKVDFLQNNLSVLEETIGRKRENLNMLVNMMQAKVQEQARQQQ